MTSGAARRVVVSLAVVVALVTLVALAAGAGGVAGAENDPNGTAASNASVSLSVDGELLVVTVEEEAFENNESTVIVGVDDEVLGEQERQAHARHHDGEYEFEFDIDEGEFDDLSEATVRVEVDDDEVHEETLRNLGFLELGDGASFDDDQRLVVPVDRAVGVPDDSVVLNASTGDGETPLTGSYDADGDGPAGAVVVERDDEFRSLIDPPGVPSLRQHDGDVRVLTGTDVDLADLAESEVSVVGGELDVQNPLVVDTEYTVTVTLSVAGQEATTVKTVAGDDGGLSTPLPAVGDEVTVTVTRNDVTYADEAPVQVDGGEPSSFEVEADGHNLSVADALAGEGNLTAYVSWTNSPERLERIEEVPYADGTVQFGEAGYVLGEGNYQFLLVTDSGTVTSAEGEIGDGDGADDAGLDETEPPDESGVLSTVVGYLQENPRHLALLLVGVVGVIVIGAVGALLSRDDNAGGAPTMAVDVVITDEVTGDPIEDAQEVVFIDRQGAMHEETHMVRGSATVSLPRGPRDVYLDDRKVGFVSASDTDVRIELPPKTVRPIVVDADSGRPVPGGEVTVTRPDGDVESHTTGDDGAFSLTVPRSLIGDGWEVGVSHERYHDVTRSLDREIEVEPRTGAVRVDTTIDGTAAGNVPVRITPADEYVREVSEPRTTRTDDEGSSVVDGLFAGDYGVETAFDDAEHVLDDDDRVSIGNGSRERIMLSATYTYEHDPRHRERIDELHRRIADIAPSNRDGAIQYYYGSVLSAHLELLEAFPDHGATFVEHGVDPAELTEAVLDGVADAIDYTRTAMTTKQNVDLFNACSPLRDVRVTWDDEPTIEELASFVAAEDAGYRGETISRMEEIDEAISSRRGDLSTVSPVREQYDRIRDHVNGVSGVGRLERRVHFFLALQMLDAIGRLFDHPELVDRLEETVF